MSVARLEKALLAALTALLLVVFAAPAAEAANFTASSYTTSFTGESGGENDVFELQGVTFFCKSHFSGSLSEASTTLEVAPSYTQCSAELAVVEINPTGCKFRFHLTSGSGDEFGASMDVVCPAGKSIDVSIPAAGCAFTIPAQTALSTVDFTNSTGEGDVKLKMTPFEALSYTVTTDDFLCPFVGTGNKTGGSYWQFNPVTLGPTGSQTFDIG